MTDSKKSQKETPDTGFEHLLDEIEETESNDAHHGGTQAWTGKSDDAVDADLKKLQEQLLRINADYQNLLARHERERKEMADFFTENFAKKLLPTLDNLERVVSGTPEELQSGVVYEWVKQAASGLSKMLEQMGISSFSSLGEPLDPNLHEALSVGPGETGKIIAEFEKGYKHRETVIRHAKVVVGNGT